MANTVLFEKDIYVRDGFGVRRRAFVAGQEVDGYVFEAVVRTNNVVNPQDLPEYKNVTEKLKSLSSTEEVVVEKIEEPTVEAVSSAPVKKSKPKRKSK